MIQIFTDLRVWQSAHEVVLNIYKITKQFPKDEMFGLSSQMRRAAVSMTSNIAEGFSRYSYKEKAQFYYIAHGSMTELQNQLIIARDVSYIDNDEYNNLFEKLVSVHKLLNAFIKKTKSF